MTMLDRIERKITKVGCETTKADHHSKMKERCASTAKKRRAGFRTQVPLIGGKGQGAGSLFVWERGRGAENHKKEPHNGKDAQNNLSGIHIKSVLQQ